MQRVNGNEGDGHGRKSEKRVASSLGARLHPASGAMQGAKSDASKGKYRMEMKSTICKSVFVEMGWLTKITKEALSHGQVAIVVVSFVDLQGKPVMKENAEWVMMPKAVFQELTDVPATNDKA